MTKPGGLSLRADVALVNRGMVRSRALAQRLIESGAVEVVAAGASTLVQRSSQPVLPDQELRLQPSPEGRFVSRGGAKLEPALARAAIDCTGITALDVGMSTGGFTDCLLHHGASRVVGIEVGHDQLDQRLATDPRVTCFEKTHVRDVDRAWFAAREVDAARFALVVVDLSFISTVGLLGHLAGIAGEGTLLLALIKPQFELGPDARNAKGIVRAGADIAGLRAGAQAAAGKAGWLPLDWFASDLRGTDGNQEYFLVARRETAQSTQQSTQSSLPETGRDAAGGC